MGNIIIFMNKATTLFNLYLYMNKRVHVNYDKF